LSLLPLGFVAMFGPVIVHAWTGETRELFKITFWLAGLAAAFQALSLLSLVLYRISGKALLDNVRQVVRLIVVMVIVVYARTLGFYGVLAGIIVCELLGLLFMLFALTQTFTTFNLRSVLSDALRLTAAAGVLLAIGIGISIVAPSGTASPRTLAAIRLVAIGIGYALAVIPILIWTGSLNASESGALFQRIMPRDVSVLQRMLFRRR
jgi:hypothetical protein